MLGRFPSLPCPRSPSICQLWNFPLVIPGLLVSLSHMPGPETPPSPEAQLTRAEKEALLQKMYTLPHWISVVRLFGYQTLAMDKARDAIKPIAEEFGKEPVAQACEVLVEIVPGKEPVAKLKAHIKRMAFQILGPEPPVAIDVPVAPAPEEPRKDGVPTSDRKRSRKSKPNPPSAAPVPATHSASTSAIMQQYQAAKEKHPDMLLLFRMGDFFELFGADAELAHTLLGLTLTTRDRTLTMAGFPHHQLEIYLHKLLKAGQRVAVCEPVGESVARNPIKREVTRVVTPEQIVEGNPVKQPRHFVIGKFQDWLNDQGHAFVAVDEVKKTTPAVAPHVGGLDFIVLRGEEKLLVTVRPHLQKKHLAAMAELHQLFGSEYRPVRIWPAEGPDGWIWREHAVNEAQT